MKLLVCGMHRSGNSAVARLCAIGAGKSILDDPEWAIDRGAHAYADDPDLKRDLNRVDIAKVPRMAELGPIVLGDFPGLVVVHMLRDPRDVWCSIRHKVRLGEPTRMLAYDRLGIPEQGVEGFSLAYCYYLDRLVESQIMGSGRLVVLSYERFFRSRVFSVAQVCERLGWQFDERKANGWADVQLAPKGNKPDDPTVIAGPGRWQREGLSRTELMHLDLASAAFCDAESRMVSPDKPSRATTAQTWAPTAPLWAEA